MATYTLYVQQTFGGRVESETYGSAMAALDEVNHRKAGGAKVHSILRDKKPIDEAALQADAEAERGIAAR